MKKIIMILPALLVVICSLGQTSSAKLNLKAKVDSLINAEMQKQRIPGLSLVVLRDGRIDHVKGYGYANLEHKVAVKPETIFQSGSVGKQFTAFAIMLLVEDGKVSLDDPLNKYFTDAPSTWEKVTVKNLLTHTGGFGDYPQDFNFRADYTEDTLYKIIRQFPVQFEAGERSQYSNIGYVTLGLLISKVTGKFYGEFLKQRIFDPLGMSTARIISEADIILNRAAGYRLQNEEIKNQHWVSPSINTTADGSLYLTILDMAKWEAGLNAGKLLKKESYEAMWSPVKLNNGTTYPYGFGWAIDSVNGKRILEHNGTWQGFESVIKRYPEKKLTVVVFANIRASKPNKIATRIMEVYQSELTMPKLKAIKDNEPAVTTLVKEFVTKSMQEKLSLDLFTPEFGPQMMALSARVAANLKQKGSFIRLELLDRKNIENDLRIYHYRLFFSKEEVELLVTLTKDNKIAHIEGRE
jgi:CubicO group peptidase (beta-lactamase class C family)